MAACIGSMSMNGGRHKDCNGTAQIANKQGQCQWLKVQLTNKKDGQDKQIAE